MVRSLSQAPGRRSQRRPSCMVLVTRVSPACRGVGDVVATSGPLADRADGGGDAEDDDDAMELKPLGGARRPPLRRHSFFNHVPSRPTVAPLSPRKSLAPFAASPPWAEDDETLASSPERAARGGTSRQNSLRPDVGQVSDEARMTREGRPADPSQGCPTEE